MRVVLQPTTVGRKTITMTNKRRQRHSPEQIVRKIQEADRILAEGGDVVAVLRQLNLTFRTSRGQYNDVPHLFCPRRGPGASSKTARLLVTPFDYGTGTLNERSGRNNTEICVGI